MIFNNRFYLKNKKDSQYMMYGVPVPQYLAPSMLVSSQTNTMYILLNTALQQDGFLRGIEVYVVSGTQIQIGVNII
jgi:hypothetical protein